MERRLNEVKQANTEPPPTVQPLLSDTNPKPNLQHEQVELLLQIDWTNAGMPDDIVTFFNNFKNLYPPPQDMVGDWVVHEEPTTIKDDNGNQVTHSLGTTYSTTEGQIEVHKITPRPKEPKAAYHLINNYC